MSQRPDRHGQQEDGGHIAHVLQRLRHAPQDYDPRALDRGMQRALQGRVGIQRDYGAAAERLGLQRTAHLHSHVQNHVRKMKQR